jgi:Zn-dependent protease
MSEGLLLRFVLILPLLLVSLVLHELAHGVVADRLGDPTPRLYGRLTVRPLRHLDLMGTAVLVLTFLASQGTFFFGWARPVPISPWQFKDPQRAMLWVGLAGPATNAALAVCAAGLVWLTYGWSLDAARVVVLLFVLNVVLAVFNLIPLPPLDGSRVVGGLLPAGAYRWWSGLDRYGNVVMIGLFAALLLWPGLFEATIGAVLDAVADALLPS